jgi:hypothetical protein
MLALTIASATQGSLLSAAAAAGGDRTAAAPSVEGVVAAAPAAAALTGADALGSALSDGAIQCLRGGGYCFGYFSQNCCAEMAALIAIAGAVGAWAAAGVGAYYYWYYC